MKTAPRRVVLLLRACFREARLEAGAGGLGREEEEDGEERRGAGGGGRSSS